MFSGGALSESVNEARPWGYLKQTVVFFPEYQPLAV